jgi:putative oxidoreductase
VTASVLAAFLVRCGLVSLFLPFSALDKTINFKSAQAQAQEIFSPPPLAATAILCGLAVEVLMPVCILSGFADRLAALVMAGYCAATAVLFKRFWTKGDFWRKGQSAGRDLFWDFLKNLSLASGFLLLTVGTDGGGLLAFLHAPLASSRPYAAHSEAAP